jgi:hypothetical protein
MTRGEGGHDFELRDLAALNGTVCLIYVCINMNIYVYMYIYINIYMYV